MLLVVNEGPDGSGKETQTTQLCARFEREGVPYVRADFPTYGEDPVADCIRYMLREQKEEWNSRSWESKALLYAANRHRYFTQHADVLAQPIVLVCNRYVPSNQAHLAAYVADEDEWARRADWIAHLEYEVLGLPKPDITLLHTMPNQTRAHLLERRERGQPDAHEADATYLARVEQCYRFLAARQPEVWRHVAADLSGVVQPPAMIHERVWNELTTHPAWQRAMVSRVSVRVP